MKRINEGKARRNNEKANEEKETKIRRIIWIRRMVKKGDARTGKITETKEEKKQVRKGREKRRVKRRKQGRM